MASTFSTSLQLQLIGSGEQSGIWGTSTNTNWNLIEQSVAGVQSITMINANYTLSVANGASDEARNMVLFVGGTNSAIRQIVAPLVPKVYVVYNNTSGGYAITIGGTTGTLATIPTGSSTLVFCDGSNFYTGISASSGNFYVAGNETVSGNTSIGGNLTVTGTIGGTLASSVVATTQTAGDNSTKVATTAYVKTAVDNATGSLGTMSTQNANAVAITGGTVSGLTSFNAAGVTTLGETTTVSATGASSTINYDVITQGVIYYTSNATANWTLNFRGNSTTTLNSIMAIGETRTITFMATQGTTAYYNNAITVDGASVTPKWQGGSAPTAGNPSSIDIYTYSIIKTAAGTFTVLASQTRFA